MATNTPKIAKAKLKKATESNRLALEQKGYRSVGEYLCKEYFQQARELESTTLQFKNVRNTTDNYEHCVSQDMLQDELALIFSKQRDYGFAIREEFEEKLLKKIFEQRPLKSFADKVGECQFIAGEKRAAKDSLSAIEFVALSRIINTLANLSKKSGEVYDKAMILKVLRAVIC